MEENDKRFERENLAVTTSFSQLLFAADDDEEEDPTRRLGFDQIFYADKTPKMLCFGDYAAKNYHGESVLVTETTTTTTTTTNKSSVTCSDSSSSASSTKSNTRKRCIGPERETVQCSSTVTGNTLSVANRPITTTISKKTKSEPASNNKRKEKLGERIAALQQLVSPFGKTDTASVLHEAMGYIRFLQEQVQVLCSPYLQRFPDSSENEKCGSGEKMKDLRSRGLCLVPVEFTEHVTNENGADLWSPATLGHVSTKH